MWQFEVPPGSTPIGYRALIEMLEIKDVLPHYRWSYLSSKWEKREILLDRQNLTLHIYPNNYKIDRSIFGHLEFALKHEGINLLIIKKVLQKLTEADIASYILKQPTSKYGRMIWFFYEFLLDKKIEEVPNLKKGSYFSLLDETEYYVAAGMRSSRHRVVNNLLGTIDFCPIVRRTILLKTFEEKKLDMRSKELAHRYNQEVLIRAMRYLYTKETLSSWEIEREKPDKGRLAKFTNLLEQIDKIGELSREVLVDLQREIVDPRFALAGYRDFQNYIGEEPNFNQLTIHYIAPKPEDVEQLMQGLLSSFKHSSECNPIITAAVLAFGLVLIHPFWDGNGRLHRLLIHYTLNRMGFTPNGLVFPVSAVILRAPRDYDAVLESFSKPLMELITDYNVNEVGELKVKQSTFELYQFIDFTLFAEYLFLCIETTIKTDFEKELNFLSDYDAVKKQLKILIDMPDRQIDLFIKCVHQNGGTLSARKKDAYFSMLSDKEIAEMLEIVKKGRY